MCGFTRKRFPAIDGPAYQPRNGRPLIAPHPPSRLTYPVVFDVHQAFVTRWEVRFTRNYSSQAALIWNSIAMHDSGSFEKKVF